MLVIHSVLKLLNTSRLETSLYITQPNQGQHLHGWYARLVATTFRGKMLVMYVHEPSLVVVVCKEKTSRERGSLLGADRKSYYQDFNSPILLLNSNWRRQINI